MGQKDNDHLHNPNYAEAKRKLNEERELIRLREQRERRERSQKSKK